MRRPFFFSPGWNKMNKHLLRKRIFCKDFGRLGIYLLVHFFLFSSGNAMESIVDTGLKVRRLPAPAGCMMEEFRGDATLVATLNSEDIWLAGDMIS